MRGREFPKWLLWLDLLYASLLVILKVGVETILKFFVKKFGFDSAIKANSVIHSIGVYLTDIRVIISVLAINALVLIFSMMRKRGAGLNNGTVQPIVINNQSSAGNPAAPVRVDNVPSNNTDGNMNFF